MCWNNICFKMALLMTAGLTAACHDVLKDENSADNDKGVIQVRLSVDGCDASADVRSILPEKTIETKVSEVTLASYDSEGRLVNALHYGQLSEGMPLYVSGSLASNVYALANMGDMTSAFPKDEGDVPDIVYMIDSYDAVASKGIPMCGIVNVSPYDGTRPVTVPMERLFAKLRTRIMHTGLSGSSANTVYAYNLCNKSLYLRQANRRLLPFSRTGSLAQSMGDVLEVSDYNPDLGDRDAYEGSLAPDKWGPGLGYFQDTTIVLYVPENVQGVLLPGNGDPFAKTAESISDLGGRSYADICTYLEFSAMKPNRGEGYSGDITYRCYLGEDNCSDFSVKRNACYDLTMNFTDEGFQMNNWKVVKGDGWVDTRTLCFVEGPFIVYPGTTEKVLVHYNRNSTSMDTGSSGHLADWTYEFDEAAMKAAGLTCTFMGSQMVTGRRGYSEHYFNITASSDAKVGETVPIKVSMKDGSYSEVASVQVARIGTLTPVWDFMPEYVSQTGTLTLAGAVDELLPLSVTVADPSVVSCGKKSDDTFVLTALHEGTTELTFSNSDGSQTLTMTFAVAAPKLKVSDVNIALAPDGESCFLDYYYVDDQGERLSNVLQGTFMGFLRPVLSGCGFVSMRTDTESMEMYLGKLSDSGQQVRLGSYYDVAVKAADCPGAGEHQMRVYVIDPFNGQEKFGTKRVDDYTLLGLSAVPLAVRNSFADENGAWSDIVYDIPPVDADEEYVSATLIPKWEGVFSNANEVYSSGYLHSDPGASSGASVTVSRNSVAKGMKHSAGKHDLRLEVKNRYSGESVAYVLGNIDVYVHTAIGAEAAFGTRACRYMTGGTTMAEVYNGVAGQSLYNVVSSDLIHYMDVSMKYLTDISGVYVFSQMKSGVSSHTNVMNALDIVRPSVADGEVNNNLRMMYSVCVGAGQRVSVCGEPYGMRKGIGGVLYRALYLYTYSTSLAEKNMETLMLGYSEQQAAALGSYSPCYTLHDMNSGSDMSNNTVSRNYPYYFSPVSCKAYRDASGNGYHVIHTLESIAPRTCGWINLLQ